MLTALRYIYEGCGQPRLMLAGYRVDPAVGRGRYTGGDQAAEMEIGQFNLLERDGTSYRCVVISVPAERQLGELACVAVPLS